MKYILIFLYLLYGIAHAQSPIDVILYELVITIEDTTDAIDVSETIKIDIKKDTPFIELDFVAKDSTGKGMQIISISEYGIDQRFEHNGNKLTIFTDRAKKFKQLSFKIHYQGIPKDGLIIGKNKFGKRTFFGDNWPNRARNWIACVDHPSDKAMTRISIISPKHYSIIANGAQHVFYPYDSTHNVTTYISKNPIPMKVIVFGAADFSHKEISNDQGFSVQSWVYQNDSATSFSDLEVAIDPLQFFIEKIGPYPFEKLANVQSTTRFGGMENAGCIFYDENAFSGKNQMEGVIAHEIAHQWFGNAVTESDWQHLWLSEGFATYLTNLHFEQKYGREIMNHRLKAERERVIAFSLQIKRPVIDTITTDLMLLLNPNSYQKGSWVLHMLRNKIGDEAFWSGLQHFFNTYKYSNVTSQDFFSIMNKESGQNLSLFFNQWLRRSEIPNLIIGFEKKCWKRKVVITQIQKSLFSFPLDIEITENGKKRIIHFQFTKDTKSMEFTVSKKAKVEIALDPNCNLLYRETKNIQLEKQ